MIAAIAPVWMLVITITAHGHIHQKFRADYVLQRECREDLGRMEKWPLKRGVKAWFLCRPITRDDFIEDE